MTFSLSKSTVWLLATLIGGAATPAIAQQSSLSLNSNDAADLGFSISVDGEHLYGDPASGNQSSVLDQLELDVRFDGLEANPLLGLQVNFERQSAPASVQALITSNYVAWIERAELRIFDVQSRQLIKTHDMQPNQPLSWNLSELNYTELLLTARVYDGQGRFDETRAVYVDLDKKKTVYPKQTGGKSAFMFATKNINVEGGHVTMSGKKIPAGHNVYVMGTSVPLSNDGQFVVEQILPTGDHAIELFVADAKGEGVSFQRSINVPDQEWFYVGLIDALIGKNWTSGNFQPTGPNEYSGVYTKGRTAFYLKGKIKGKYLITASADSNSGSLSELLTGWGAKDPRSIVSRLDPDEYYPVYGDSSTIYDDTPTQGKFYVRVERGNDYVMWGNFKTTISDGKLFGRKRALYGFSGVLRADEHTANGDPKSKFETYAAQAGTVSQQELLRGTGGSAYFLRRSDIAAGSEHIELQSRDPISGTILASRQLLAGQDYELDYLQGILLLKEPLSSNAPSNAAVTQNGASTPHQYISAKYEYAPAITQTDAYSLGATAEHWVNDNVKLGATYTSELSAAARHELVGVDIRIQKDVGTFIEAQIARSQGKGVGRVLSHDGGLTHQTLPSVGQDGVGALAYRIGAAANLKDISGGAVDGKIAAEITHLRAGFSSDVAYAAQDTTTWTASSNINLTDQIELRLGNAGLLDATGKSSVQTSAEIAYQQDQTGLSTGVSHLEKVTPAGPAEQNGSRSNLGARVSHEFDEGKSAYVFVQATAAHTGGLGRDDRVGVGGRLALNDEIALDSEISHGTTGLGLRLGAEYSASAAERYYVGYALDPEKSFADKEFGTNYGKITVGSAVKHNDEVTTFTENGYDVFGLRRTATSAYGISFTPDRFWTTKLSFEEGSIVGENIDDIKRAAVAFSGSYDDQNEHSANLKAEARRDESADVSQNRSTFLASLKHKYVVDGEWTMRGSIDSLLSISDQSTLLNGQFLEASLGFAYRPAYDDRMQFLFKYSYLYDLPGAQQVNAVGSQNGPAQKSSILSADLNYDISKMFTLGAKYGYRFGAVSQTRDESDFVRSSAHLMILRGDLHLVKEWDLSLEGRALFSPEEQALKYGGVAAVYYHMNDNIKLGGGYKASSFTDDLRNLEHGEQGLFINVVSKH